MTTNRVLNSGCLLAIVSLVGCYNLTGRTAADAGDAVAEIADVRQPGDAQGDLNALDATDAADLLDALDTPQNPDDSLDASADAADAPDDADVSAVDVSDVAADACALTVCGGACVDTRSDARHCGSCARDCTALMNVTGASVRCEAGACVIPAGACDAAHGDCDGDASNGCEEDLTRSSNCGACGTACSEPTPLCAMMGASRRCVSGCDAMSTRCGMRCSNTANDPANCGACDNVCPVPSNGVAACASGRCGVLCEVGFHLCAGRCVDDTLVTNCGARCEPCALAAHAATTCSSGACGFTCDANFADCDGDASNGCETDTSTSGAHCGRCSNACTAPAGSVASCVAGRCEVMLTCSTGQVLCGSSCQTVGATCTVGVGACVRTGTTVCSAAGGSTTCSVTPGASATETCDGIDNDCDGLTDEGFCRIGGVCFADGQANPANACLRCVAPSTAAGSSVWSNAPAGFACRAVAGPCDVVEACDGTGAACPVDRFMSAGVLCRAMAGVCDLPEVCTGTSVACPIDLYAPTTVVCRASAGVCDRAETCTASSAACPADGFQTSGVVCRPSASVAACDPPESCTGSSLTCPSDLVVRAPSAEVCDGVDNNCNGLIDESPAAASCPTRSNATSTCAAGTCGFRCNGGYSLVAGACVAGATTETCNYVDDDGDGLIDEGFSYQEIPGSRVVRAGDVALWPWPVARGTDRFAFAYYNAGVRVEVLDLVGAHVATSAPSSISAIDFGFAGFDWVGDRFFFGGVSGGGCGCQASGFSVLLDGSVASSVARLSSDAPIVGGYLGVNSQFLLASSPGRGMPVRLRSYLSNGAAGSIDRTLITPGATELIGPIVGAVVGTEVVWVYGFSPSATSTAPELQMLVTGTDGAPRRGPFTIDRNVGPPQSLSVLDGDVVLSYLVFSAPSGYVVGRWTTSGVRVGTLSTVVPTGSYFASASGSGQAYWCTHDSGTMPGLVGRVSASGAIVQPGTRTWSDVDTHYRCSVAATDNGVIVLESNYSPSRIVWARFGCALPRQVAPLSTATVSSRRPTLRWTMSPDLDGARVQICSDRACATIEQTIDAVGTSARPTADLAPGVHYWRLFGRRGAATGTLSTPVWEFFVGRLTTGTDTSWIGRNDLNGDGISDLVVGAPAVTTGGRSYVYPGATSGPAVSAVGPFACSFPAAIGDVNGDGYGDLACAIVRSGTSGTVSVLYGGATGVTVASSTTIDIASQLVLYNKPIAAAGDVNGDGYGDLAVGLRAAGTDAARVLVFLGGASGVDALSPRALTGFDPRGVTTLVSLSSGDLNADGFSDLVVGSSEASAGPGHVFVYLGSAGGLPDAPTVTLTGIHGTGVPCDGGPYTFGYALAANGDLNGDGFGDLLVGAPGRRTDGSGGRVYLFPGGPAGVSTTPSQTLSPAGNYALGSNIAYLADGDGDGYDDLALDDYCYITDNNGRVYVHRGGPSGLNATPDLTLTGPSGSSLGRALVGPADVNGDGYGDLIAALPRYPSYGDRGRVQVFLGGPAGISSTASYTRDAPDGGSYGTFIARVRGAGDRRVCANRPQYTQSVSSAK